MMAAAGYSRSSSVLRWSDGVRAFLAQLQDSLFQQPFQKRRPPCQQDVAGSGNFQFPEIRAGAPGKQDFPQEADQYSVESLALKRIYHMRISGKRITLTGAIHLPLI